MGFSCPPWRIFRKFAHPCAHPSDAARFRKNQEEEEGREQKKDLLVSSAAFLLHHSTWWLREAPFRARPRWPSSQHAAPRTAREPHDQERQKAKKLSTVLRVTSRSPKNRRLLQQFHLRPRFFVSKISLSLCECAQNINSLLKEPREKRKELLKQA